MRPPLNPAEGLAPLPTYEALSCPPPCPCFGSTRLREVRLVDSGPLADAPYATASATQAGHLRRVLHPNPLRSVRTLLAPRDKSQASTILDLVPQIRMLPVPDFSKPRICPHSLHPLRQAQQSHEVSRDCFLSMTWNPKSLHMFITFPQTLIFLCLL